MTAACVRTWTSGGVRQPWNLAALFAGMLGAACVGVVIAAQADPSSLNWPLILVPAAVVPLPLLVPGRAVRVTAAVVTARGDGRWRGGRRGRDGRRETRLELER